MKWPKQWRMRSKQKQQEYPKAQQLQNPYRRMYTQPKSLEQLARQAREEIKKQHQQD